MPITPHSSRGSSPFPASSARLSDLVRMECLVGPLRTADQIRLLAFGSVFSDCTVVPLHPEVMERAADLRASTRLQTTNAIHLAAAVHWDCHALNPASADAFPQPGRDPWQQGMT